MTGLAPQHHGLMCFLSIQLVGCVCFRAPPKWKLLVLLLFLQGHEANRDSKKRRAARLGPARLLRNWIIQSCSSILREDWSRLCRILTKGFLIGNMHCLSSWSFHFLCLDQSSGERTVWTFLASAQEVRETTRSLFEQLGGVNKFNQYCGQNPAPESLEFLGASTQNVWCQIVDLVHAWMKPPSLQKSPFA